MDKPITLIGIQKGKDRPGDCGNSLDNLPYWIDVQRFYKGQAFFQKHMFSIVFSMHFSLVSGFAIINLLEPLVYSNKSNTPQKALRRYVDTFYHILLWCMDSDMLSDTSSRGYKSILKVRAMHKHVADGMNTKIAKANNELFISQYDMGLVQSGFMGAVVMYPKEFGINCSIDELNDYIYLWRVIAFLLGIEDEYNICSGNFCQTYSIVKEIEQELLIPALLKPPEHFDAMSKAYMDGVNSIGKINLTTKNCMLALSFDAFKLPPIKLSWKDSFRFYFLKCLMFALYWIPPLRIMINWNMKRGVKLLIQMKQNAEKEK